MNNKDNKDNKEKAYVVLDKTLEELTRMADTAADYTIDVYKKTIDRPEFSEEQKKLQEKFHWIAKQSKTVRISELGLQELVEKCMYDEVLNGCDEDIEKKVYKKIIEHNAKIVIVCRERSPKKVSVDAGMYLDHEKLAIEYDLSDNEEELLDELKKVNDTGYTFGKDDDKPVVWLEEYTVNISTREFLALSTEIRKKIKKTLRENFTYCIKSGRVIVPEEYLKKGTTGIEEWRKIKSSSNKNNSMEKKILHATYREKRSFAEDNVHYILRAIISNNRNWKIPTLTIDGMYNKGRKSALVTELFKDKSRQEFMKMSEEDIVNKIKEYWKNILMDAYNAVDAFEPGKEQ